MGLGVAQPTEATLQTCEESGTDIAQAVRKSMMKQKRSSGGAQYVAASNVEQVIKSFSTNMLHRIQTVFHTLRVDAPSDKSGIVLMS